MISQEEEEEEEEEEEGIVVFDIYDVIRFTSFCKIFTYLSEVSEDFAK